MGLLKRAATIALTTVLASCATLKAPFLSHANNIHSMGAERSPVPFGMMREEFYEATGAKLHGHQLHIEYSPDTIQAKLAEALLLGQKQNSVDEVLVGVPGDQIPCEYDAKRKWYGMFCERGDTAHIVINPMRHITMNNEERSKSITAVINHELGHSELEAVARSDSTLFPRLTDAVRDSLGNSTHFNEEEKKYYWADQEERIPIAKRDLFRNILEGHFTTHSRANPHEQGATFLERMHEGRNIANILYGPESVEPMRKQAEILTGILLPEEFLEYREIETMWGMEYDPIKSTIEYFRADGSVSERNRVQSNAANPESLAAFNTAVTNFLDRHPRSEYRSRLQLQRARNILRSHYEVDLWHAVPLLEDAINAAHDQQRVRWGEYNVLLEELGKVYADLDRDYESSVYSEAAELYAHQRTLDPRIALYGVKDFLNSKHVLRRTLATN